MFHTCNTAVVSLTIHLAAPPVRAARACRVLVAAGSLGHVADNAPDTTSAGETYPGQSLGLPPEGRGSLASWRARIGALIIDWAACMIIAIGFFGTGVLTGGGWRAWMILATFFVESTVLSWLVGQLRAASESHRRRPARRAAARPATSTAAGLSGVPGAAALDHFR